MKHTLAVLLLILSTLAVASEVPAYLKDGTITVTLKNGKQYTFSANDYMVVKRGAKSPKLELAEKEVSALKEKVSAQAKEPKRTKHIVSAEAIHSNRGLDTSSSANHVDVKSQKQLGLGLQYQYNVYEDLYMGGRIDTNGGTGLNFGIGF
jgi:hypothetical protein